MLYIRQVIARLKLFPDKSTRKYSPPIDCEVTWVIVPVLLFAIGLVVLPLAWKFVLLFVVIIIGGYLLNKAANKSPKKKLV